MNRTWVKVYAAAVCFGAVTCMTVATGVLLYSVVRVSAPSITVSPIPPPYTQLYMNAAPRGVGPGAGVPASTLETQVQSPSQADRMQREYMDRATANERRNGLRGAIYWSITLLVSSVLWVLHWRVLKIEQSSAA